MNHLPPRNMDPDYGPDLSEAAEQALGVHYTIQSEIASLLKVLHGSDGMMGMDQYGELFAALEDAARKPGEVETMIYEMEFDRLEDERMTAAEARWEARRDEELS